MKLTLKPRTLVISFTSQLQRSSVWSPTWYSLSVRVILYFLGSNKAELWKCWSAVSVAHRTANAAAANFRQWCVVIRDKREKVGVRLSRHSTRSTKSWATLGCLTADKSLTAKPQSLWRSLQVLRCVFQSCGLQKKKNKWDKLEKLRIQSSWSLQMIQIYSSNVLLQWIWMTLGWSSVMVIFFSDMSLASQRDSLKMCQAAAKT